MTQQKDAMISHLSSTLEAMQTVRRHALLVVFRFKHSFQDLSEARAKAWNDAAQLDERTRVSVYLPVVTSLIVRIGSRVSKTTFRACKPP